MERNIIRDLLILKQMNIKLNFSELARIYDMDNHTVVKYWLGGGIKKEPAACYCRTAVLSSPL